MSTKTTTDQSTKFDPSSKARYDQWGSSMLPQLQALFSNPFSSPFFNLNMQQQTKGATQVGGRNTMNALTNFQRSGMGGTSMGGGAMQSLLAGLGRSNSALQYQGFMNAANQAQGDRWNAASLGSSLFQPLTTGSKGTQTTGGLGTWLPQLVGAGLGVASGFMGGAKGGAGGGGGGGNPFGAGAIPQGSGFSGGMWGAAPGAGSLYNPLAGPTQPYGGG